MYYVDVKKDALWNDAWNGNGISDKHGHFIDKLIHFTKIFKITILLKKLATLKFALFSRYIQILWALEFAETHVGRPHAHAFDICSADLTVSSHFIIIG